MCGKGSGWRWRKSGRCSSMRSTSQQRRRAPSRSVSPPFRSFSLSLTHTLALCLSIACKLPIIYVQTYVYYHSYTFQTYITLLLDALDISAEEPRALEERLAALRAFRAIRAVPIPNPHSCPLPPALKFKPITTIPKSGPPSPKSQPLSTIIQHLAPTPYRGTSLIRKHPLWPYTWPMPRALRRSQGWVYPYERGTPLPPNPYLPPARQDVEQPRGIE